MLMLGCCRLLQLNIGTSAYAALLRVLSGFHEAIYSDPESPTGLNQVRRTLVEVLVLVRRR